MQRRPSRFSARRSKIKINLVHDRFPIEELDSETLVYDQARHQAHCLPRLVAVLWKDTQAERRVPSLERLVALCGSPVTAEERSAAIAELRRIGLLPSPSRSAAQRDRRRAMGALAVVGAALVFTLVAPSVAEACSTTTNKVCNFGEFGKPCVQKNNACGHCFAGTCANF